MPHPRTVRGAPEPNNSSHLLIGPYVTDMGVTTIHVVTRKEFSFEITIAIVYGRVGLRALHYRIDIMIIMVAIVLENVHKIEMFAAFCTSLYKYIDKQLCKQKDNPSASYIWKVIA